MKRNEHINNYYDAFPNGDTIPDDIKIDPPKYKGFMGFDHKTGGTLQICTNPETFAEVKAKTARKGQSSILRMTTPRTNSSI